MTAPAAASSRRWLWAALLVTAGKLWLTRGQPVYALGYAGHDDRLFIELAAHLRFQPGCEELPVVAITGSSGPEDMRRSRAKGFSAHLVKPVEMVALERVLAPGA